MFAADYCDSSGKLAAFIKKDLFHFLAKENSLLSRFVNCVVGGFLHATIPFLVETKFSLSIVIQFPFWRFLSFSCICICAQLQPLHFGDEVDMRLANSWDIISGRPKQT